ncbi:MAG: PD40 domain-containing protein [Gemmatimonadetes bacterium]|nr:PD40 domain-containing protein [Gemmatimonadota bacterium]
MIESMNVPVLMLVEMLTSAAVPIVAVAIGAILLQLVFLICAAPSSSRDGSGPTRSLVAGVLLLGLGLVSASAVQAQGQPQEDIPQVEARYTRVFGSDTIQVVWQELSPDGRWIAFSSLVGAEKTDGIWLVSTDGGEPIQLTTGKWDVNVAWFPTSDRIAFQSTRIDDMMIMTLSIDPATGRATGPAQRITLEGGAGPLVSPDGDWIAYRKFGSEGVDLQMALKVVPARGGSARTLAQLPGRPWQQSWSLDSRYLYFYWSGPDTQGPRPDLMRISVDGGNPEKVTAVPIDESAPANPYLIYKGSGTDDSGGPLHVIATVDRQSVAQVSLPKNVGELGHAKTITPDGQRVVAVVDNTVSPLRVLPVAGGTGRQLGDARTSDLPIGWTPDGQRVVFQTEVDGRVAVMVVPVGGGAAEEYTVIPGLHMGAYRRTVLLSEDGGYVAFRRRGTGADVAPLVIARVSDGEIHTVSESPTDFGYFGLAAPGGLPTDGDEFLYLETGGDNVELRAASFDRPSRLLRVFPTIVERRVVGVFEDRVVWTESTGDSTEVMIADGPAGQPRLLATVAALFEGLVWSPDGRWIAGGAYFGDANEPNFKIMLIGLNEAGAVVSPPRFLDTQIGVGWGIRWLPDSEGLTVFAQSLPSYRTDVWLFSLREGEPPVALTKDETTEFWYYSLSPDGRHIAYPAAVPRGSSIWMVDLGDMPAGD